MWNCGLRIRAALSLTHPCQSGNQGGLGRRATSSRKYFTLSNLEPLRTSWVCNCLQCLQSSRSQVGGSNPDSSVEEKFQKTLNPWTGRSQLPPETFKFELRPVWWGAGTERHSPPPSLLAKQLLKEFDRFVLISTVVFLGDLEIYFFVPVSGHCTAHYSLVPPSTVPYRPVQSRTA